MLTAWRVAGGVTLHSHCCHVVSCVCPVKSVAEDLSVTVIKGYAGTLHLLVMNHIQEIMLMLHNEEQWNV